MKTPSGLSSRELDRRAECVQLGEPSTLVVGHEQLDDAEPTCEAICDPRAQLVQTFTRGGGDLQCAG